MQLDLQRNISQEVDQICPHVLGLPDHKEIIAGGL